MVMPGGLEGAVVEVPVGERGCGGRGDGGKVVGWGWALFGDDCKDGSGLWMSGEGDDLLFHAANSYRG